MSTKRWLEEGSDAGERERELLRAGLDREPPGHVEDVVFERLRATLGPNFLADGGVPTSPDVATTAATNGAALGGKGVSATFALFGKGVVVGVGFSFAAVGGARLLEQPARVHESRAPVELVRPAELPAPIPRASPSAPVEATPAPTQKHAETRQQNAQPSPPAQVTSPAPVSPNGNGSVAVFPPADSPALASASQLRDEAQMLRRARDELRAGALSSAFATLEASRRQFSAPELAQEREALTIELLHRSGETTAARERARAFIERFPESPHSARIRGFSAGTP